jgi:hypothetical protein
MAKIEITIDQSIQSNDWLRVATKRAKAVVAANNTEWLAAEIFVKLPEQGRCFMKRAGDQGFTAYG